MEALFRDSISCAEMFRQILYRNSTRQIFNRSSYSLRVNSKHFAAAFMRDVLFFIKTRPPLKRALNFDVCFLQEVS